MDSHVWKVCNMPSPNESCTYTHKEMSSIGSFNLKSLSGLLTEVKEGLRDNEDLSTEIQMMKVLIYKVRMPFRSDKQVQPLMKVSKCLKKLVELKLPELVDNLNTQLKEAFQSDLIIKFSKLKLPSRKMFEYVLLHIQATTLLLVYTLKAICTAHSYGLMKIYNAHFLPINIVIAATLSRLWVLLKIYLMKCIELYQRLLPLIKILKGTPFPGLSDNEKFPDDLSSWLKIDSLQQIVAEQK